MASQYSRIEKIIRASVKKLKRGEIPVPPDARSTSPQEEKEFVVRMKAHRERLQRNLERLKSDGSRRGHKRHLQFDAELVRLNEMLGDN